MSRLERGVPDFSLALSTLFLVSTGILLIFSASSILAYGRHQDSLFFVKRQLAFMVLGLLALGYVQTVDLPRLRKAVPWILAAALLLTALVLVPGIGRRVGGARRWIALGPLRFQPSEFLKMAMVLFSADQLSRSLEAGKGWRGAAMPVGIACAVGSALVMLEPDFGSTVLMLAMVATLFLCAGMDIRTFAVPAAIAGALAVVAIVRSPYRLRRILIFLDPWKDPNGAGFQMTHSMMAFGTGGVLGQGLGEGRQKLYYLPEPHTDFIFATAGEELGLLGCLVILAMFLFLLWRCWLIVFKAKDTFVKLASLGLTFFLGLQIIANLWVVTGLAPTKGTTLPFLSSGGSALIVDLVVVGFLLNFSKRVDTQ